VAEVARAVRGGAASAAAVTEAALARIARGNPALGAFTEVTADRARARAAAIDRVLAEGGDPGPLAGVPFAAKNLFDIAGLPTRAGSRINRSAPAAARDAVLIARLERHGAVLVGALNMGEYAYDFTGENLHDGPSRNPHDLARMTGGSSGGSGAAVAAGLVAATLGSDTNGSIRVPASLCGVFGLVPTYGRLPRTGSFPFVPSLDRVGPMARGVGDLALLYDAVAGHDAGDPACRDRPAGSLVAALAERRPPRAAVLGGYFARGADAAALAALARCAAALEARDTVALPDAALARAAAYVLTAAEGAALHLGRLRTRGADFDPAVRDRLIAGAVQPAAAVAQARRVRRALHAAWLELFARYDVLLAPATPCPAPLLGQTTLLLDGEEVPLRASLGLYAQPLTFPGPCVVVVPVAAGGLPMGVQIVAAPWQEHLAMRAAALLEAQGVARAPLPEDAGWM
jgi:aspartyl-tRNA(Asn)/glutamyl-tRNA(Gln) amidotransferase subunit A